MAKSFIGTSGWVYEDWRERFYPIDIKPEERLEYYVKYFNTVELNASFYHLPRHKTFENWGKKTPERFVFSAKISKYITQNLKLKNARASTELFLKESAGLGKKLGVILVQLPPNLHADKERLRNFLKIVAEAVIARSADQRFDSASNPREEPVGESPADSALVPMTPHKSDRQPTSSAANELPALLPRFAFEFRHESWLNEEIYSLLRKYKAGFVIQDSVHWPRDEVVTSNFVYLRFHGPGALYSSNYPDSQLKKWAVKIKKWLAQGLDVYAYFNNDINAYAVKNALELNELVQKS